MRNFTYLYIINQQVKSLTPEKISEGKVKMDLRMLKQVFQKLDSHETPVSDYSIRKIMDFSRSYLNVPLKGSPNAELVLN